MKKSIQLTSAIIGFLLCITGMSGTAQKINHPIASDNYRSGSKTAHFPTKCLANGASNENRMGRYEKQQKPNKAKAKTESSQLKASKKAIIFSEDFEGVIAPAFPAGWSTSTQGFDGGFFTGDFTQTRIYNCPDPMDYFPIPDHTTFAMTNDDCCNCDKSKDYLEMPSIDLTGLYNYQVTMDVYKRENPGFADSAYVEVSVDSGATWTSIHSMKNFTVAVWQEETANLSAFDNMPDVRIRFHYNDLGNWGYGLCIDNVVIKDIPPNNLSLDPNVTYLDPWYTPTYTKIPFDHKGTSMFEGTITNDGVNSQTNVVLNTTITHNGSAIVYNENSASQSLAPGVSNVFTTSPGFTAPTTGTFDIVLSAASDSIDDYPTDNTVAKILDITDTIFARDKGTGDYELSLSSYGGVVGPGYKFACVYETYVADTATSISVSLGSGSIIGTFIRGMVYDSSEVEIGASDFYQITAADTSGGFLTLPITTPPTGAPLGAQNWYFAAIEELSSDSDMTVRAHSGGGGGTTYIFDGGDNTWYNISAIPLVRMNTKAPSSVCNLSATNTSTNVSCPGGNDGSIDLTVIGGTGPFTYAWSNSASTEDIDSLTAGSYNTMITDSNGCSYPVFIEISEPSVSFSITNISCKGDSNGAIDLTITLGTAPFTYSWSNGDTTEDIDSLSPGSYLLLLTDSTGCILDNSIQVITEPDSVLSFTISSTLAACGINGTASVIAAGGTFPYFYLWSPGGQTSASATGLSGGTYMVTVTDANGCNDTSSVVVPSTPGIVSDSMTVTDPTTCVGSDGTATPTITGGTPPYAYAWNDPGNQTNAAATGLSAGTYQVLVMDSLFCSLTDTAVLSDPPSPVPSIVAITHESAANANDGAIDATVTGGTGSGTYTYSWSNGDSTEDISSLAPGSYTLTVTDSNGCTGSISGVVNMFVGIGEIHAGTISIHPNPNNGQFVVELKDLNSESYHLEVRNIIGQIVYADVIQGGTVERVNIDLNNQEKGVYVFSISNSNSKRTEKLIVH